VSKVSTVRKLGVVARVASQQAGRNRVLRATGGALAATGRAFGKVLHQLWLEVTGLVFLLMALSGGAALAHEYSSYHAGKVGFERVVIALCFTVMFAWFGVSSFWRVKRKGKSARDRAGRLCGTADPSPAKNAGPQIDKDVSGDDRQGIRVRKER